MGKSQLVKCKLKQSPPQSSEKELLQQTKLLLLYGSIKKRFCNHTLWELFIAIKKNTIHSLFIYYYGTYISNSITVSWLHHFFLFFFFSEGSAVFSFCCCFFKCFFSMTALPLCREGLWENSYSVRERNHPSHRISQGLSVLSQRSNFSQ